VASNDSPDGASSPDGVEVALPSDTSPTGSSAKMEDRTERADPVPEKPPAKGEVVSAEEEDDEEGAVWSIGGKKK